MGRHADEAFAIEVHGAWRVWIAIVRTPVEARKVRTRSRLYRDMRPYLISG
ncbi:hypothetical protein SAMN05216548_11439 [Faunimonas pinastri]|uniref:Uncharacterized protein n=1 Tax=Faunimonas pinastri TaxID=1855383 RepID=A0A1H9MU04_9HYPH|nr:hypothetical protein SAMN05216548_11439 [Faunimonas pinastri]